MFIPKYIELADGHIVVFAAYHQHISVARALDEEPVSAGFVRATRDQAGCFYGDSFTLKLAANKNLRLNARPLFEGVDDQNVPMFSTSEDVLRALGAKTVKPAGWEEGTCYPFADGHNRLKYERLFNL